MLWDGRRAPFTLLGGYLGAGKTTIVNSVLRRGGGRRIVVLVNDVASVNVDAGFIIDHDGVTLSLTNGCVCCAIADDFGETLERVRAMPEPPDRIVMELSGVAEPARVAPWANTAGFRLDGVVVVADADQIVSLAARPYVGDTIREQLRAADVVLLTKTDLADDGGAAGRSFVREHTAAPIVPVVDGDVDTEVILGSGRHDLGHDDVGRDTPGCDDRRPASLVDAGPRHGYESSVVAIGPMRLDELRRLVDELPADTIRAKGLVTCTDQADPVEAHVVGTRRSVRTRPDLDREAADQRLVSIRARS